MRNKLVVVATAVAALLCMPPPAAAVVVDCEGLQAALGGATAGTTVTLAAGEFCPGEYQPAEVDITIEGQLANGAPAAGFEPAGATDDRSLFVDSHGATTTVRNLIFRGGAVDAGGLFVIGDGTLNLSGLVFEGVRSSSPGGGLRVRFGGGDVVLENSTFTGNDSGLSGGGARIEARTASVSGSSFTGNAAGQHGGGLALTTETFRDTVTTRAVPAGRDAVLSQNTFSGNLAGAPASRVPAASTDSSGRGGGLFVGKSGDEIDGGSPADADGQRPVVEITGGAFALNTVSGERQTRRGGGIALAGVDATLDGARVVRNAVLGDQQSDTVFGGTGGGISLDGLNRSASLLMVNSAVAANDVGAGGEGGGVFLRCGDCFVNLRAVHSTISGNRTGANGSGAGVIGRGFAGLDIVNSIVWGNLTPVHGDTSVEGFEGWTAVNSDVCDVPQDFPSRAADAFGNICEDPLLADPAGSGDVHQTGASPTIDAAPAPGNDTVNDDFEGDLRPTLVSDRSATPYDMGADEYMQADFRVTLSAAPNPVKSGEQYTVTAQVSNAGPSPARSVRAVFGLGGATLVSATPDHGSCTGAVTCELGDIAVGGSVTITLVLKAFAPDGRADVDVTTTATVSSSTPDPATANNSASATVTVRGAAAPLPVVPAPAAPASGSAPVVTASRCGSRRYFEIRVRKRRRDPVVRATIRVDGKRVRVRRVRGRLIARVNMLLEPKRTITVTISARTRSGRTVRGKRVYHPCEKKRPHTIPEL